MFAQTPALPFAAALIALLAATPASATIVKAMTVEEMAREATAVVVATVTGTTSAWEEGRIVTRVTLAVSERLRGAVGEDALEIAVPGGAVGDLAQQVPGTPQYSAGDEVFVFLWRGPEQRAYTVLGLSMGSFRIQRGVDKIEAVSDRRGIGQARPNATGALEVQHVPGDAELRLPLDTLRARVRAALEAK
jgi:hypothetical protein